MLNLSVLERVDYLVVGHLTKDLTDAGPRIGGTSAYAALTAKALGMRVGIVTAWAGDVHLGSLKTIPIFSYPSEHTTTFENIYHTENGHGKRTQYLHKVAESLDYHVIPETWRNSPIIHLGPVAQEVEPSMVRYFSDSLVGITPQGWLRTWDADQRVKSCAWVESSFTLSHAGAAVLSVEDVDSDEDTIEEMATHSRILAVTESDQGSRLYWNGDVRRFTPPEVEEVDATGAGDIYAAAFFTRLFTTRDPWESARFATQLAAYSVTRKGLEKSVPTQEEIQACMIEVL